MKKFLAVSALFFTVVSKAQVPAAMTKGGAGPVFVEEVKKLGSEAVISYKRYKLSNGLNILIHEDHSDPIVYVDVTYHVGSAREQQGRSGFAHFFEHMMFQGSKNVADEQHFKIITESGGTLNGTTNTDRTNYFEVVPSNQLEKMLWLESDRMGFLLDSVTQRKFEVQRATVKNERGQRYDNAPYGVVQEKIGEMLFPQGHPYSWTTIGYIEDLNRVDVNDLKRFYMRWYGPNNAVLTISGDVKTDEALLLAQKYFGSIQRGPEVSKQSVDMVKLEGSRYRSYEDNVRFPQLSVVFPTVKTFDKDEAPLEVLSYILSGSQGSPFYKAFIETKKAVQAQAYQVSRELAGQFALNIRANPGTVLSEMENEITRVLGEWEKKGATDDDINRFKAQYETRIYNRLSTVQGKGASLAAYFTFTGNANQIKKDLDRYLHVTKEDVMRVYNTYIKGKPAAFLSCVPKDKGDLRARPDNWKMYERKVEEESAEYKNLKYNEPKDDFDRSKMPKAAAALPVPVPDFYTSKINKTVPVIGVKENEIPLVNILISFKAGHRYEAKEKSGLAQLTADMLEMSTMKTPAEEMENKIDRLGSNVSVFANDEEIGVSVQSSRKNLKATLKIVEEMMYEPKFDKEEFEVEKKSEMDGITQGLTNASVMAENAFRKILYGKEHIMAYPGNGTAETVSSITIDDVKKYYESINSSMMSVAVSGDISEEEVMQDLAFLSKMKTGSPLVAADPPAPKIDKTRIYFIDKKNAAQSEIRVGYLAMPYDYNGDFYRCQIMNFSFSGAFNGRVNYLLREVKGWTYGAHGGFSGSKFTGPFAITGGFKANTTDSALTEIFKELKNFSDGGITEAELDFTKHAIAQSDALKYESPQQKLFFIKRVLDYDLPKDYVSAQTKILNDITKEKVNEFAKKYLPYNNMVVVVVGDRASNLEKVKKLGYEVVELDASGKTGTN